MDTDEGITVKTLYIWNLTMKSLVISQWLNKNKYIRFFGKEKMRILEFWRDARWLVAFWVYSLLCASGITFGDAREWYAVLEIKHGMAIYWKSTLILLFFRPNMRIFCKYLHSHYNLIIQVFTNFPFKFQIEVALQTAICQAME